MKPGASLKIYICLWHLPVTEWNRLQHALHGNGALDGEDFGGLFDNEDFDRLGDIANEELLELEILLGARCEACR